MMNEREESKISQLIKYRELELTNTQICRKYHSGEYLVKLPVVSFPKPIETLLASPSLWLKVENFEYTPSFLVKSFFVRKDGQEIDKRVFSVFIADAKRSVAERWGWSHSLRGINREINIGTGVLLKPFLRIQLYARDRIQDWLIKSHIKSAKILPLKKWRRGIQKQTVKF